MFKEGYIIIGDNRIEVESIEVSPKSSEDLLKNSSIWKGEIVVKKNCLSVNFIRELTGKEVFDRLQNGYLLLDEFIVHYEDD